MEKCTKCGVDLAAGAAFCAACGHEVGSAPETKSAVSAVDAKRAFDEVQSIVTEFRTTLGKAEEERKSFGQERTLTAEKLDRLNTRLDEIETKMARPPASPATPPESLIKIPGSDRLVFDTFARYGASVLDPAEFKSLVPVSTRTLEMIETKALTTLNDPSTGYLCPPEMMAGILKNITEFSPIRQYARVRTTTNKSAVFMKKTGSFSATWVGEAETGRTEATGLAYAPDEINTRELSAYVDVSQIDLEDNAFDLEAELRMEFGEQFGVAEGTAFVSGSGPKQPEGLLTNADVSYTAGGDASLITADGMIAIYYDLKDAYARNATWFMRRATLKSIRQLKLTGGQYIWQPGLQAGEPASILGRPYVEVPDMPAIAENAYPVIFGDMRRAYMIVDRIAIVIIRDALTQATSGLVRFVARKRVGGQVVLAEAIRKLKIATS